MRRKCRYIAVLCAAACVGAGAPAQAFAQEAGGTDCAGTEVTFTAGNDGAMTAAAESGKIAPVKYEKGSYVVGRDIPAGEYAVFASLEGDGNPYRTCSFTLYKNDSDEKRIGTFRFEHHGLVTLYDGQHLVLQSGYAVPAGEAKLTLAPYGMYLAGRDMEPGSYLLTPLTADGGYFALYNDVRYYYDYQDGYRRFLEPTVITVSEGQYLELGNIASIVKLAGSGGE